MSNSQNQTSSLTSVIASSSVGTLIEWYDFYIFGSLADQISKNLFPPDQTASAYLSTLAIFAIGFIVRPFGALFFGRLGDLIGRKYTFLVTLILMGGSTFMIGLVPSYAIIGWGAPILAMILRILQGLALGGEYGGAATYVAEHAPVGQRGFWTSWIQTTATLGLFVSLFVIILTRQIINDTDKFDAWGWRIPFLVSIVLVLVSIVIRMRMHESPLFAKLKAKGETSTNPLKESFAKKENLKMVLLALFGATCGQGVVWYTGQFYAQSFLQKTCMMDGTQSNQWIGWALVFATPFFVFFGWLSDKIGRKVIMMGGLALALVCTRPLFEKLYATAHPSLKGTPTVSITETHKEDALNPKDTVVKKITTNTYADGSVFTVSETNKILADAAQQATYKKLDPKRVIKLSESHKWTIIGVIFILVLFVTMVYGPIAAFLVEIFPTRIRYTSMSLPYHIGNGVFGGLVPFIATLFFEISKTTLTDKGDPFAGLVYPLSIMALCLLIGTFFLPNKNDEDVTD
jgi:MFS family permease